MHCHVPAESQKLHDGKVQIYFQSKTKCRELHLIDPVLSGIAISKIIQFRSSDMPMLLDLDRLDRWGIPAWKILSLHASIRGDAQIRDKIYS